MPDGKDTNEVLDFSLDLTSELSKVVDTISSVVWTVPDGLTLVNQIHTSTVATVFLGGGVLGKEYEVSAQITTNANPNPRIYNRSFRLQIRNK